MISTVEGTFIDDKKRKILELQKAARAERYALQAVSKELLPNERVVVCLRNMVGDYVEVHRHIKSKKAFYSGLMVCGSVWLCPICAAKISERRKVELLRATAAAKSQGIHLAMLTLTIRHNRKDSLKPLLDAFNDAVGYLFKRKEFSALRKDLEVIGRIKALEVTHGRNGWHPHAHIVFFSKVEFDFCKVKNMLYKIWEFACRKYGLSTTAAHGLDLQGADHVQAYMTKHGTWSIEQEMTKSHIKKAKNGGLTPFDLLRDVLEKDDDYSKALFVEYGQAFKGRQQLHWSRGLKTYFGIKDLSDQELAEEQKEHADILGALDADTWRYLYKNGLRAQFLDFCESHGFNAAMELAFKFLK